MGRWLAKVRTSGTSAAPLIPAIPCAGNSETRKHPAPSDAWHRLLADAGPLRGTLEAFRAQGTALNIVDGRVFFGPYDDYEDCSWRDAAEWWAAYRAELAPHEPTLRALLARLLDEVARDENTAALTEGDQL